jgi:hypothetical protein
MNTFHRLGESIPPHGVNVFLLPSPSLPSYGWLLARFHLLIHPLHHALHPNRWLPAVLIILHLLRLFKVLGFIVLGFATMIGKNKSLLRPLMLRSLAPWCMMPRTLILRSLMPWCLIPWSLIRNLMPWSLILSQRSCAVIYLSGHFFLDLCSLSFEKGALGSSIPT